MNKTFLTRPLLLAAALLSCALPRARAQDEAPSDKSRDKVEYALIMPEEKSPELVKLTEPNPFEAPGSEKLVEETNSEQNRIKDILGTLPCVGLSTTAQGQLVAYMGDIKMVEKKLVPHVLPDQTIDLRVDSITPVEVTLVWLEKKPTGLPPQKMILQTNIAPSVNFRLPGSAVSRAEGAGPSAQPVMGVQRHRATSEPAAPVSRMAGTPPRAVPVDEQMPEKMELSAPVGTPGAEQSAPASALMNLLFGNPVKNEDAKK
jgi:hypothetical protein